MRWGRVCGSAWDGWTLNMLCAPFVDHRFTVVWFRVTGSSGGETEAVPGVPGHLVGLGLASSYVVGVGFVWRNFQARGTNTILSANPKHVLGLDHLIHANSGR